MMQYVIVGLHINVCEITGRYAQLLNSPLMRWPRCRSPCRSGHDWSVDRNALDQTTTFEARTSSTSESAYSGESRDIIIPARCCTSSRPDCCKSRHSAPRRRECRLVRFRASDDACSHLVVQYFFRLQAWECMSLELSRYHADW